MDSVEIWRAIRKEYETTHTSYKKLSKKHGYSVNAISTKKRSEGWIKFQKRVEIIQKEATEIFAEESTTKVLDLIRKEDGSLDRLQGIIDEDVPYQEIIQAIERMDGKVAIKMDGTVKGLVEATMMIGNKRRELRGVLPLKDQKLIELKEKDQKHRHEIDKEKLEIERKRNNNPTETGNVPQFVGEGALED